ncbi:MAG: hypothetical protein ACP5HK_01950 [Acidilobus sp.]
MSQQQNKAVSKDDLEAYLRKRIEQLEEELRALKTLLEYLEDSGKASPTERVEDVRVGRRRVARILRGDSYVRAVPELPLALPREIREYLQTVEAEIRAYQARSGEPGEGEGVRLSVKEKPDGSVSEVKFDGLFTTLEVLKAKAALKYAMETAYDVYRAQMKSSDEEAHQEVDEEGGGEEAS